MFSAKHFGIENWQKIFFQKQIIEERLIFKECKGSHPGLVFDLKSK
jgi:hypothetical protein